MIWKEKPLTSVKKGIAGSYNRKSRDLEGETAGECEKRIVGSRGSQTAEKSPKSNFRNGGNPWSENNTKLINTFYCYTFVYNN